MTTDPRYSDCSSLDISCSNNRTNQTFFAGRTHLEKHLLRAPLRIDHAPEQ